MIITSSFVEYSNKDKIAGRYFNAGYLKVSQKSLRALFHTPLHLTSKASITLHIVFPSPSSSMIIIYVEQKKNLSRYNNLVWAKRPPENQYAYSSGHLIKLFQNRCISPSFYHYMYCAQQLHHSALG